MIKIDVMDLKNIINKKEIELLYLKWKIFISAHPFGVSRGEIIFWMEKQIERIQKEKNNQRIEKCNNDFIKNIKEDLERRREK